MPTSLDHNQSMVPMHSLPAYAANRADSPVQNVPRSASSGCHSRDAHWDFTADQQAEFEEMFLKRLEKRGRARHIHADATRRALKSVWGRGRAWQVRAIVPKGKEADLAHRSWMLLPHSKDTASDVLGRFKVGAACTKGAKQGQGQDNFSVSRLWNVGIRGGWTLYLVADGHGNAGHWISERLVKTLPYFLSTLECQKNLWQDMVEVALSLAFERAEEDLIQQAKRKGIPISMAGSTCTCLLSWSRSTKVWVATIGDSRAIFFSAQGKVLRRTIDHKPSLPAERQRIEDAGGEVRETMAYCGVRVFKKGCNWPGLAVSRAFGDILSKEAGVTAEPEIVCWDLAGHEDGYLLAASDGVWEFLTDEQVARTVSSSLAGGSSMMAASKELVRMAQRKWVADDSGYCDDVTVLIVPAVPPADARPPAPIPGWSSCSEESCFQGVSQCALL